MGGYMEKRSKKLDIIVIVSLLLVSLIAVLVLVLTRKTGESVVVEIDGEYVATYSLATDGTYSLNNGTNVLIIEGGKAYMSEADCPDKTCVKRGGVSYSGESIVCLPNRITVTVKGNGGVDLVS